ncbi:MAG: hypothetical protein JW913_18315 [Chitinispirillaceae bacterium]|nr:hypothetical protein [Chitinispirillaceae bacterium]
MRRLMMLCSGSLLLVLINYSCTGDRVAGTAGSETVNTFAVVVVDHNKQPVSGASIRIIAEDSSWLDKVAKNEDPLFLSVTSGKDGIARIPADSLIEFNVNLCVDSGTIGAFVPSFQFTEDYNDTRDTIVLKRGAVLSGSINTDDAYPSRVMLLGTDYSADVDQSTGEYAFAGVPAGDYHVIAMKDSTRFAGAGSVVLAEGDDVESALQANFSGVFVDDFDIAANLMSYFKIGNWYIAHGGAVTVTFPTSREKTDSTHIPYKDALVAAGARAGKSLHVNYNAESADFYLIVGAKASTRQAGFTHINTITFWAKGSGILTVRLHGEENIDKPQALAYAYLDTMWRQFTVTSDMYEILDPSNKSATWDDVKKRMTWLSFMPGSDGTDFWLDDIWLKGIAMRDLIVP